MDYLNNSLLKSSGKYVKFTKDMITVVEGANTHVQMKMGNWQIPFEQYFHTNVLLKEDTYHYELNYGALGTQITFLALKVTYEPLVKTLIPDPEIPRIEYIFATNAEDARPVDNFLILTGTKDKKLPQIYLNNPNKKYKARVEMIASTTEIHADLLPVLVPINTQTFDIHELQYTNIVSDDSGYAIIIQRDADTPLASFALDRVSNLEINGRLLIVDDTALGVLNLFFTSEFHCLQAYSLINWALKDPENNKITVGMPVDTTAPVITYTPSFTTEFNIENFPLNGTNGSDGYSITKTYLRTFLIDSVTDNRDGAITIDNANITITKVNQNLKREAISEVGKYNFVIDVSDAAGNKTSEIFVLNVKDTVEPKIILSSFGYDLYNSSTAGTSGLVNQTDVYIDDFYNNTITKQDLLDLIVSQVTDLFDGNITVNTNNVSVTITAYSDNLVKPSITAAGIYDIYIQVADSHGNVGDTLYRTANEPLSPINHLLLEIKENQAPDVIFLNNITQHLYVYGGQITKTNLKTVLVDSVVDDRDGIITNSIVNLSVFQYGNLGTAGTNSFVDGTNSYAYNTIPDTEILYIDEQGVYKLKVVAVDSDGEIAIEEISLVVLP